MSDDYQNTQYSTNQPPAYQPQQYQQENQWPHMTMGNWLVTCLLMLIPIANIVLMFMWAFGSNVNPSKKSFFRASLIMAAIGIGLSILLGGAIAAFVLSLAQSMS